MTTTTSPAAPLARLATSGLRRVGLVVAGVVLMTIGAKVQVPFWPVPMTLQTLALMLIIGAGGMRLAVETVFAYLALGLAGLPVFAGAAAGPAYFAGPTAGFLIGFLLAALVGGFLVDRGAARHPLRLFGALILADAVLFASGVLWLGLVFTTASGGHLGLATAFAKGAAPFLLADLLKVAIAALAVSGLARRSLGREG